MKHAKALGIKFVLIFAVLLIVLGMFFGMSFGNIFTISLVLTAISYAGDVLVLPRTNNTVATIADFALAFLVIWFLTNMLVENAYYPEFTSSLVAAAGVAIGEVFFHRYLPRLNNDVVEDEKKPRPALKENYSMETSEEFEDKD